MAANNMHWSPKAGVQSHVGLFSDIWVSMSLAMGEFKSKNGRRSNFLRGLYKLISLLFHPLLIIVYQVCQKKNKIKWYLKTTWTKWIRIVIIKNLIVPLPPHSAGIAAISTGCILQLSPLSLLILIYAQLNVYNNII